MAVQSSPTLRGHMHATHLTCVSGKRAGPRGHESRKKTGLEDTIKKQPESK